MKKQSVKRMKDELSGKKAEVEKGKSPRTRLKAYKNVGTLEKDLRTKMDADKKNERTGMKKATVRVKKSPTKRG